MKYIFLLSLLISVVVGVTSHDAPAIDSVTQMSPAGVAPSGQSGNPMTNAATAVVQQTEAATKANQEAIRQWEARNAPAAK